RSDDLLLRQYRPRTQLRAPAHLRSRPLVSAIDAHNHLGPTPFAGAWSERTAAELAVTLDACGIAGIVDLDGGHGDALRHEIDRWRPIGDRVAVFAGLDVASWPGDPAFGETEARSLREGVTAGAAGLKVWKTLGLRARDEAGRLIAVDDARLDPVWATAGELGVPVTIHIADPIAFFEPLDETNERWEELIANPDWHFSPT